MLGLGLGLNKNNQINKLAPLKACGLLSYAKGATNGLMIDKVGRSGTEVGRDAIQARTIIGNGSTYIDTGIVPNQSTVLRVWGNFKSLTVPSTFQIMGCEKTSSGRYYFGFVGSTWVLGVKNSTFTNGVADIQKHKFELNDGELFIDDIKIAGVKGEEFGEFDNPIAFLTNLKGGNSNLPCNFNLDRAEIDHNGVKNVLVIESRDAFGKYTLKASDGNHLQAQQFLSPATPTQINLTEISNMDEEGYTVADGTHTYDQAGTQVIPIGTLIPNANGKSTAYVNGELATPQFSGRVKINYVVTDAGGTPNNGDFVAPNHFKLADNYNHVFTTDSANTLTTAGVNNVIEIATIPAITNNQLFVNTTNKTVGYYETSLIEPCLTKAKTFQGV